MDGYEALEIIQSYIQENYHAYVVEANLPDFQNEDIVIEEVNPLSHTNPVVMFLSGNETIYNDGVTISNNSDEASTTIKIFIKLSGDSLDILHSNIFKYISLLRVCLYHCNDFEEVRAMRYSVDPRTPEDDASGNVYGVYTLRVTSSESIPIDTN